MRNFLLSKTVWFNAITTIIGIAAYLQTQTFFEKYVPILLLVVGVGNIILRIWFTQTPLMIGFGKRSDT
jgi:nicotinamide riboside transporter PnuC